MTIRHLVGGLAVCTAVTFSAATDVSAWDDGSGRICTADGQIIVKPTEQEWNQYLHDNKGSKPYHDGVVCTPTTTTTGSTTSTTGPSTSSPATTTSTVPSSTTTTTAVTSVPTTAAPPSSQPAPSSTPNSDLPPTDMMCASSMNSERATAEVTGSDGCATLSTLAGSQGGPTTPSPAVTSSPPSTLPSTGTGEGWLILAATTLVLVGGWALIISRRGGRT